MLGHDMIVMSRLLMKDGSLVKAHWLEFMLPLKDLGTVWKLGVWEEFGSVNRHLKDMRARLEHIRSMSLGTGPSPSKKYLMRRISELLSREEAMARQRSRITWLLEGDRNTGFFQEAKERHRTNKIKALRRDDGSYETSQTGMENMAINFYRNLFTAQDVTQPELVTAWVPRKITYEMNASLCAPVTDMEIEQALFMMHPDKSPGPDGFMAGFYIKHWSLLKGVVCNTIRRFLNGGEMPEIVNSTVLVLIPKIKAPQDLTHF